MLVYWDANPLASQFAGGITIYAKYLLRALQSYGDLDIVGLVKLSRLKRRHWIKQHATLKTRLYVPPFSDWFLSKKAIYHGVDFKVPPHSRLPRVATIHDLGVFVEGLSEPIFQKRGIAYLRHLLLHKTPERIIVPTHFVRQHMLELFPQLGSRIRVIEHGADHVVPWAESGTAELPPFLQKAPFILCPGAVEERKNGARLIAAFERSRAAREMFLVFAGNDGFNHEAIHQRAQASPAKDKILFLPGLSATTLVALYRKAIFTAYPSLFEGFGLPIVEAFALGSPLLTSKIGAMAEVAGEAAVKVDPYSEEELTQAIDLLSYDAGLREKLSQSGKIRAKEFRWEKSAAQTRETYLELAGK
ncbi:MAG: glycosyltransferase family 4 protein [Turneriella sp.]|nr:glycosyltransferase family 4 protein [Turneriella sp.]